MHKIVSSRNEPGLTLQFRQWVESEWGNVDSFEPAADDIVFPSPILALDQHELLGGLSFTSHIKPDSNTKGVWINTLYVAPEFRHCGIGAELVKAAETEARKLAIGELYVYTDISKIYQRLGWEIVKSADKSIVLKKLMPN